MARLSALFQALMIGMHAGRYRRDGPFERAFRRCLFANAGCESSHVAGAHSTAARNGYMALRICVCVYACASAAKFARPRYSCVALIRRTGERRARARNMTMLKRVLLTGEHSRLGVGRIKTFEIHFEIHSPPIIVVVILVAAYKSCVVPIVWRPLFLVDGQVWRIIIHVREAP